MIVGSAERPNSISKKRFDAALLLYSLSDWPSASSQQEPILFPVQQVLSLNTHVAPNLKQHYGLGYF